MRKIFWGLLFLLIDLKINEISLTPAFVGYILIYMGMGEISAPQAFQKAKPWAIAGIIWTALFWLPLIDLGELSILTGLAGTAIHLVVTWQLVQAVKEMGLDSEPLRQVWVFVAVFEVLSSALVFLGWIALIAIIICFIAQVVYIVRFNRCKKALEL